MMEMHMDWEAEKNEFSTTAEHSEDSLGASDFTDDKPSLLLEVEEISPSTSGLSDDLVTSSDNLPLVMHCGEDESTLTTPSKASTYCLLQDSVTGGIYVPVSTASSLLCEDKKRKLWSSGCSSGLPEGLKDENIIILVDSFDAENLPPLVGKVVPYPCEKCGKSFQDLCRLEAHKKICVRGCSYWCPVCGKEFFRAANLRMHKLTHAVDRPHKCPECEKGFIRTADVWRHLRSMHKIDRSSVVLGNANLKNPWCILRKDPGESWNAGQQNSAARNSGEGGSKRYQCPVCCKAFNKSNLLSKHEVIHWKEKPHKCNKCGMAFVQLVQLKRHHQTHSGQRPFCCKECGSAFTCLASLQRHQRIHTGEKPYSCAACGWSFAELGILRRHEGIHKVVQS